MPPKKGKRARATRKDENGGPRAKVKKNDDTIANEEAKKGAESKEGMVLSVGMGETGQLGLGEDIVERKRPAIVNKLQGENIASVECGGMHTVALTGDGKAYSWGCNDEGALGRDTAGSEDECLPGLVRFDDDATAKIIQVSAGDNHTAFLHENGSVSCCGAFRDSKGVIGLTASGKGHRLPIGIWRSSGEEKGVSISSGNEHVAFLTNKGNVFTFGVGEQGQLGRIAPCFSDRGGRRGLKAILKPERVHVKWGSIRSIFCGGYHTFAISASNEPYAWGLNNYGQLGVGDAETSFVPRKIVFPNGVIAFSGAQHHSLALAPNGCVYACGRGDYGRLGLGDALKNDERRLFTQISSLKSVSRICCAGCVSFAVTDRGTAYSWGMGTNLQLAVPAGNDDDDDDDVFVPHMMKGKNIDSRKIRNISAGGQHVAILAQK